MKKTSKAPYRQTIFKSRTLFFLNYIRQVPLFIHFLFSGFLHKSKRKNKKKEGVNLKTESALQEKTQ